MLYINEKHIREIGIEWTNVVQVIEDATACLISKDFAQPIKPYLRYRDHTNRIIAMPAFVGGKINKSGIKWIASFPGNLDKGIRRANSVTVVNEADTGVPIGIINTTLISEIRTAGVTGFVIKKWREQGNADRKLKLGMTGFGPIGQIHLSMIHAILGEQVDSINIFDPRPVDESKIVPELKDKVNITRDWQSAYKDTDVFMTCTVSKAPYIDKKPKEGSLQLNVSLRDYVAKYRQYVDLIIVDDWGEVCREKTDIEIMHLEEGLMEEDTFSIADVLSGKAFQGLNVDDVVMFNPMGLAIFDIGVSQYFFQMAEKLGTGTVLD